MICPVCQNNSKDEQSCKVCGWKFVYFTNEPTDKQLKEYDANKELKH